MAKFFRLPFGINGDRTAIPEPTQGDGSVSYNEGYPIDYQKDPEDPDVKYPERDKMNDLFYQICDALKQYQTLGFFDFITSAMNNGSPYSYDKNAYVRYDDGSGFEIYYSLVDANTSDPTDTTKWSRVSPFVIPTGTVWEYLGATLPSGGWIWPDGGTIGSASSGATNRANADTSALYTLLWNAYPNAILPIQTSGGVASTRGASAAADFAANKRLPVPDRRGRVGIGKDNMGGTAANRITSAGCGIAGTVLGASGGVETVALTSNQNGPHIHSSGGLSTIASGDHQHNAGIGINPPGGGVTYPYGESSYPAGYIEPSVGSQTSGGGEVQPLTSVNGSHTHTITGSTNTSGIGEAHQNVQPGLICNYILKL